MITSLPQLARESLATYLQARHLLQVSPQDCGPPLTPFFNTTAGVFVTLKIGGHLRGCIGTITPTQPHVIQEVISNACAAGTRDPRFPAVSPEELDRLSYSVSVMHPPEAIADVTQLDPQRYGVIVKSGQRQGLLLPQLEGIDHVEQQIFHARQKAGIPPNAPLALSRFQVDFYEE